MLRAVQLGLSISDLYLLDLGIVQDMIIESINDNYDYPLKPSQEDFDKF